MDETENEVATESCYMATDDKSNKVLFRQYRRGDRIIDWLIETRQKISQHKWKEPIKQILINSLDKSAREYAFNEGLSESDSFNDICNVLEEIFRYDGRMPFIIQLYNKGSDKYSSNEAVAAEIYCRTKTLLEKRKREDLIEETALYLFIRTLGRGLGEELLKFDPRTLQQALEAYPKALERYYEKQMISDKENILMGYD